MQRLAGDERRPLEIQDRVDDVVDLAHTAERMQAGEAVVRRRIVSRSLDHPERDRVDAHAARRVLDRQRPGHGDEPALGERRERGGSRGVGVVDEARGDVDDVAAALGDHLRDRALGDVEEPGEVDGGDRVVVVERVLGERLADVDPGVVDQGVDPAEPVERLRRRRAARSAGSAMSPATVTKSSSSPGGHRYARCRRRHTRRCGMPPPGRRRSPARRR